MPACRYMEENASAAMLATKRLAGVAPEVSVWECITHTPLSSVNMSSHSGFEAKGRCHQKSKTGLSVKYNKDMCPPNFFKKLVYDCE